MSPKFLQSKLISVSPGKFLVFNPFECLSFSQVLGLYIRHELHIMVKYRNRKTLMGDMLLFLGISLEGDEKKGLDFQVNLTCTK